MTRQEYAHARAVLEFEEMHDSPEHWAPWEHIEFPQFVAAREAALLNMPTSPSKASAVPVDA